MTGLDDNHQENPLDQAVQQFVDARLEGSQPDIDEFVKRYPELERQIREKIRNLDRVNTLFDSLVQAEESDFEETAPAQDLVGQKVGAFEIVEMIGKGGMGVVYLARDTKLDRSVAIKSLPAELQVNSTARTRFAREAKLLASLSHPNIGVIHDIVEPTEGNAYLVLEYIPGETLAERMAREPLELNESLVIALQIAEAVRAAHEAGVMHRDLKPSNIKITPDGRVKVLDFGLAKTTISKSAAPDPTVTQAGGVMGTPAYMSPEQARGKPTDRRTDIWSFGCLLYEMLTGHLPFEGETTTDVLARIIERDPDWNRLPPRVPANIRVLLWRCLAKDLRRRLQHLGDAVLELDETLNVPPDKPGVAEPTVKVDWRRRWWSAIAFSLAGIIVGLIGARIFLDDSGRQSLDTATDVTTRRTVITLPEDQVLGFYQATTFGLRRPAFALSPDGSRLVYVAPTGETTQLFERLINRYEVRPIPGTDGASLPSFSPDGQSVGFFVKEQLKTVSLLGGDPVTLCEVDLFSGAGWSDDGMIYFTKQGGLSRVAEDGGEIEFLDTQFDHPLGGFPQVLPGGKAVLISSLQGEAVHVSLETMEKTLLVKDILYARYVPTGHLVYVRAGALWAVPLSLATLKITGPSVPVIEKILSDSLYGSAQFAFSNDGTLVYVPGGDTGVSTPTWIDRQRKAPPQELKMPAQVYGTPKLSPDGQRLAIRVNELRSSVYVYDIATGMPSRFTLEGDEVGYVWTPDGSKVVFSCVKEEENEWNLLCAQADGSGKSELLYSAQSRLSPASWYPDGNRLMLYSNGRSLTVLSVDEPRVLEPVCTTDFAIYQEVLSPDGKHIAYAARTEGDFNVYVSTYPEFDRTIRISPEFGEEPLWSNEGNELFYRNRDKWMVVPISIEPEFIAGTPEVIFEGPYINVPGFSYDVAPDGQQFLVLKPEYDDSQVRQLNVVSNWFDELKQRVPAEKD
jgi:serine/threonine-protein kinase